VVPLVAGTPPADHEQIEGGAVSLQELTPLERGAHGVLALARVSWGKRFTVEGLAEDL